MHRRRGILAPLILNVGAGRRCVVIVTAWSLYLREGTPLYPLNGSFGSFCVGPCSSVDVLEKRKVFYPAQIQNPDLPVRSVVTVCLNVLSSKGIHGSHSNFAEKKKNGSSISTCEQAFCILKFWKLNFVPRYAVFLHMSEQIFAR